MKIYVTSKGFLYPVTSRASHVQKQQQQCKQLCSKCNGTYSPTLVLATQQQLCPVNIPTNNDSYRNSS